MCLIIDANSLSKVFKSTDRQHSEFQPVLAWIIDGNGKIIIGGSKIKQELLGKIQWFRPMLMQLLRVNKVVMIDDDSVDIIENRIKRQVNDPDFDDPHLLALIIKSKTKIVCSQDKRAYPYIGNKSLYPKGSKIPAIYSGRNNRNLLIDANICKCCTPKVPLNKAQTKILRGIVS